MINIAVDGFSGSGKSTLVKKLAKRLKGDFKVLDTGAIFRAFGCAFDSAGYHEMSEKNLKDFLKNNIISVKFIGDNQHLFVNDEDITDRLRDEKVGQLASKISVFPIIREKYLEIARDFAKKNNCLMEGRDISTVVMPNANVKIFLTAEESVRAKRRFDELLAKGVDASYNDVLKDLQERDLRDTTRDVAPLRPATDSIIVDNSDMTFEETVDYCLAIIEKTIGNNNFINIAIDGYVCSGKSTIAKALAKRLGFKAFDTGAIYRGVACAFEYMNYDENKISEKYIKKFSEQVELKIEFINGVQHVFVNGIDHTANLRLERTSKLTAKISPFTCIREKVLKIQRDFARKNNIVMEGRDIGSHVLLDADFKFFCVADEIVRATRRYEQQKTMGNSVDFDQILKELRERDYKDVHREHGALTQVEDSIIVDTTNQNLEQSVEFCVEIIKKKYPNIV